jgi:hypothetical protein
LAECAIGGLCSTVFDEDTLVLNRPLHWSLFLGKGARESVRMCGLQDFTHRTASYKHLQSIFNPPHCGCKTFGTAQLDCRLLPQTRQRVSHYG